MPHNIGQMFYFGEKPWHPLGKRREHPATLEEAIADGGLEWEVGLVPIQTAEDPPSEFTRRMAVVRTDRKPGRADRVLGVVHPEFRPLQNRKGFEIFDALLGEGRPVYHTGGYLGSGEVVWLMAHIPDNVITVQGKDIVEPYLLFSNSHDGTRSIDIRLTTIRVVCQNTLNMALSKRNSEFIFKQSHSVSPDRIQKQAEIFFKFLQKEIQYTENNFQKLAKKPLIQQGFDQYLSTVLPYPKSPEPTANEAVKKSFETRKKKVEDLRSDIKQAYCDGYGNENSTYEPTLWGAMNAVTAYVDHIQLLGDNDHYAYTMFGEGARLKELAYEKALEAATI
jgi:phage/plasmid-like protein (TIGR03299 family)